MTCSEHENAANIRCTNVRGPATCSNFTWNSLASCLGASEFCCKLQLWSVEVSEALQIAEVCIARNCIPENRRSGSVQGTLWTRHTSKGYMGVYDNR